MTIAAPIDPTTIPLQDLYQEARRTYLALPLDLADLPSLDDIPMSSRGPADGGPKDEAQEDGVRRLLCSMLADAKTRAAMHEPTLPHRYADREPIEDLRRALWLITSLMHEIARRRPTTYDLPRAWPVIVEAVNPMHDQYSQPRVTNRRRSDGERKDVGWIDCPFAAHYVGWHRGQVGAYGYSERNAEARLRSGFVGGEPS